MTAAGFGRACTREVFTALLALGTTVIGIAHADPRGVPVGQIDIVAERAYLRTGLGSGPEVTDPFVGEQLFLHVEYRVDGSSVPVSAAIRGLIDGVPLCVGAVDLQPRGRFQVWCQNAWRATPGLHTLRWELDADDAVPEVNELNNVVAATIDVPVPDRDVVAERGFLRSQPGGGDEIPTPALDQQVFFHLDYRLNNLPSPIRVGVRALIDGTEQCTGAVMPLSNGLLQVWCNNAWSATSGPHTLLWQVDPADEIDEVNEDNNETELAFVVGFLGDANCDGLLGAGDLTALVTLLDSGGRATCRLDDTDANGFLEQRDLDATIQRIFGAASTI